MSVSPPAGHLPLSFHFLSLTKEASLDALAESWKGLRSSVRSLQLLQKCALPAGLVAPPPSLPPCFSPGFSAAAEFLNLAGGAGGGGGGAGAQFAGKEDHEQSGEGGGVPSAAGSSAGIFSFLGLPTFPT